MKINPPLSPFIKGEGIGNLVPLLDKGGARGGFVISIEILKHGLISLKGINILAWGIALGKIRQ